MNTREQNNPHAANGRESHAEEGRRDPSIAPRAHYAVYNLNTRRRDTQGNRLPESAAYSIATSDAARVAATQMEKTLIEIERQFPGRANSLRHFYDHIKCHVYDNYQGLRQDIATAVEERKRRATEINDRNLSRHQKLRARLEEAIAADLEAIGALDKKLLKAHRKTAKKVARTGGVYNPSAPSEDCVLRRSPLSHEAAATGMCVPFAPEGDKLNMPARVGWFLSAVVGALVGVSLGITVHSLDADFLHSLSDDWGIALFWWAIGFGITVTGKYALQYVWGLAGEERYVQGSRRQQAALLFNAAVVFLALLSSDLALERKGLLAMQAVNQGLDSLTSISQPLASGRAAGGDVLSFWLIPLLITLGYLTCAASEGFLKGRILPIRQRVLAQQEQDNKTTEEIKRSDTACKAAFNALSRVQVLLDAQNRLHTRTAQSFAQIEKMDSDLEEITDEPNETEMHRIQEAYDQLRGAEQDFDHKCRTLLDSVEPLGGRWQRAWRGWSGIGRSPRIQRDAPLE